MKKCLLALLLMISIYVLTSVQINVVAELFIEAEDDSSINATWALEQLYNSEQNVVPIIWRGDTEDMSPLYNERLEQVGSLSEELPQCAFQGTTLEVGVSYDSFDTFISNYLPVYNQIDNNYSPYIIESYFHGFGKNYTIDTNVTLDSDFDASDVKIVFILSEHIDQSYISSVIAYDYQNFNLATEGATGHFSHSFDLENSADSENVKCFVLIQKYSINDNEIYQADEAELIEAQMMVGAGTMNSPYILDSFINLNYLSKFGEAEGLWNESIYFEQHCDIDASVTHTIVEWGDDDRFQPIGTSQTPFKGNYNGNGYIISNLSLSSESLFYGGLFGKTENAVISSINLTNLDFSYHSGGLIFLIEDDYENIGNTMGVGGLIGYADDSEISKCSVEGTISGKFNIGGLVGYSNLSTISMSKAQISLNTPAGICGGLIGSAVNTTVENCYSISSIDCAEFAGGLVGRSNNVSLTNCFVSGSISGDQFIGGLEGYSLSSTVDNCFWDVTSMGIASTYGEGTGVPDSDLRSMPYLLEAGWDLENAWNIDGVNNNSFAFLRCENIIPIEVTISTPENISIQQDDKDIHMLWDSVNSDAVGHVIDVSAYAIFYNQVSADEEGFYFLAETEETEYWHRRVCAYTPEMFYKVVAIDSSSRALLNSMKRSIGTANKLKYTDFINLAK